MTKVTNTSNLILHKMTSTDLDECLKTVDRLKTRFRPQIGSSRVRIREKRYSNLHTKYQWIFSYLFKRYLSLRSMFQMFSFFQVTNKKKTVTSARLVPVTMNTVFLKKKKRHCCFEVVNVFSLALATGIMQLEITWAFRMTRSLLVKYRCMSCYIKFIPCLYSTLQVLISPPANILELRYSPNSN